MTDQWTYWALFENRPARERADGPDAPASESDRHPASRENKPGRTAAERDRSRT